MNPSKSRFTFPYDSTAGVNNWFYLFALGVVLYIVIATLKAFWDDEARGEKHFGKWARKRKVISKTK